MMIRVATEEDWPSLRKMVGFLDAENVEHRQQSVEREIVAGMLHAFATGQEIVVAEADGGELSPCAQERGHSPERDDS